MKTNKNNIFGNYFWIVTIAVGVLLSSITFFGSVYFDKKTAQTQLSNTVEFIKERDASYRKYNDVAAARSLIRSTVSVQELDDLEGEDEESLKSFAEKIWVTGISILDSNGNLVTEYTTDGVGYNSFASKLEFSAFSNVIEYPSKTYMNRITLDDDSYADVAVKKGENNHIVLAYRHTKKEFTSKSTLSIQNILNGYNVDSNGTILIVEDNKVIASNDKSLIDQDVSENKLVLGIRYNNQANTIVRTTQFNGSGKAYGIYSRGRENYIYAYLPESAVFTSAFRNVLLILLIYIILVIYVQTLRVRSNRKFLAQQAKQEEEYKLQLQQKNMELERSIKKEAIANKSKREFLFNMSHDIRTPMNAIIGFTSLAATHIDHKEQVLDYLKKISVSSQHLLSLINDILDMSRLESGKVKIDEKTVHLPDVIHDIKTIIQSNIASKRLSLLIDTMDVYDEDIITDPLRLNQILLNILSNAIKFTPAGGTISIQITQKNTLYKDRAEYEFRIKDNGIGMSDEFKSHIFEEFAREDSSTVSGIQGTGLGLAIVKRIVDLMDGTIEVNTELGKGTEFIVSLTFMLSDKRVEHKKIQELEGLRALVADDDTNTCLSVSKMLRTIGMRTDWTISGKEAVIRAKDAFEQGESFHVYIIDWLIPDMNGVEVVRNIRKFIGKDTPIIILTAYDYTEIEQEAKEAGVTAFCSKPLFMSDLREILEKPFISQEKQTQELPNDLAGKKVLLVEDNDLNREIALEVLKGFDLKVDTENNGQTAIERLKKSSINEYDVILMDVQMPVMDGYEATRKIRELGIQTPIYALTANAFEEDKQNALESGMDGHIAKPFDAKKLYEVLTEAIKKQD